MLNFLSAIFFAADGDSPAGFLENPMGIVLIVVLVLLLAGVFIMPMFTNRKKNSQANDLYANLTPGCKIMTIGGIIGTIVEVNERSPVDKELLIETGAEGSKTTLWIDLKGVYQNLSKPAQPTNFFGRPKTTGPVAQNVTVEPSADFAEDESDIKDEPKSKKK